MAHRTEHGITFFDFETISEAQALLDMDEDAHVHSDDCDPGNCEQAHYDQFYIPEDDERDFEEEAFNQALLDEARAEAEQAHHEEDPEYLALYFPGPDQDVDPPF